MGRTSGGPTNIPTPSSPVTGDYLYYNGSGWVSGPPSAGTSYFPCVIYGSGAAVTANEIYLVGVTIPVLSTITGVCVGNAGTAAGNLLVSLFNSAGTNVAKSGSTAMSGTFTTQAIAFTAQYTALPGQYFIGVQASSTSANFYKTSVQGLNAEIAQGSFAVPGSFSLASLVDGGGFSCIACSTY